MDEKVASFLEKVREIKKDPLTVVIPSTGKKAVVSDLNFKQQKNLISTIADGAVGALTFQKNLNNIVLDNTENSDNLFITDKLPIILNLRTSSLGLDIKLKDRVEHLSQCITAKYPEIQYHDTIDSQGLVIGLTIPTIKEENQNIDFCIQAINKEDGDNIGTQVNIIYTYEVLKYIQSIQFGDESLVFKNISNKDRINVLENLPLSINKRIVGFIQDMKEKEKEILKTDEGSDFEINVSFFDS